MTINLGPAEKITRFDEGAVTDNGSEASFAIITSDDVRHRFWCGSFDLHKIAHFALHLVQFAVQKGGGLKAPIQNEQITTAPIAAVDFGIAEGRSPHEVLFSVHFGTPMPLVFSVSPNKLAALKALLEQHLRPIEPQKLS